MRNLPIIGRDASISVKDLGDEIPAKVDSGAYRSSIHATDIKEITKDGVELLQFTLMGHPAYKKTLQLECAEYRKVTVENSFGQREDRFAVEIDTKIEGINFKAQFTLADRQNKTYPVLLGRLFLADRFLVDVTYSEVNRSDLRKLVGKKIIHIEEDYNNL